MFTHIKVEEVLLPAFVPYTDREQEKTLNVNNLKHLVPWTGSEEEWYNRYNRSQARYNFDFYGTAGILATMVNCRPVCYELKRRHVSTLRDIGALGVVYGLESVRRMYADELASICQDVQLFLDGHKETPQDSKPQSAAATSDQGETMKRADEDPPTLAFPWFDDETEPESSAAASLASDKGVETVNSTPGVPIHKPLLTPEDWKAGIFVRTNACSPKDALQNTMRPLHSLSECVEAVACSSRCQREFNASPDATHSLIFAPWQPYLDGSNEFRVFVHQGIVTAMSQYVWHKAYPWMLDHEAVTQAARNIVAFWHDRIAVEVPFTECIMDVAVLLDASYEVKLIEFNPFGLEFASGSALFHWQHDADKLFSKTSSPFVDEARLTFPGDKPCTSDGVVIHDLDGARARQGLQSVVVRVARP
jgi:hypothetical protein